MGKGVRPLDGDLDHSPGSSFCFGVLIYPDGRERICESAGGSGGPYSAYRYAFTDCLTGERIALEGDREQTPPVGQWRPITSAERLKALTGLEPPRLRDGSMLWEGAWWTKERRNPIMRGVINLALERDIACTHHELKAILRNYDPETDWCNPRFNNVRDFAERVADTASTGLDLRAAVEQQYTRDLEATPRWCWRQGTRQGRQTAWCAPAARDVNLAALAAAGGLPMLLAHVEASVEKARGEIEREVTAARLEAAGGALQEHLFAPDESRQMAASTGGHERHPRLWDHLA
jgi:hypothetical protein